MKSQNLKSINDSQAFIREIYAEQIELHNDGIEAIEKTSERVKEYYKSIFSEPELYEKVFNYDGADLKKIKPGTLVRFECMVQDPNLAKEMQLMGVELENEESNEKKYEFIQYTIDNKKLDNGWKESANFNLRLALDTEAMFCTSIPGRSEWLVRNDVSCDHEEHVDDKVYQEFMVETRSRFPLPQIEFSSAILKFYGDNIDYKANQAIQVIGIFDWSQYCDENSKVLEYPCIKVLCSAPLPLLFPYQPPKCSEKDEHIREELTEYIAKSVGGDSLVAKYLLLLLLSRANTRAENAGKLTINLTGLPLDPNANRIQAPAAAPSSFGVGSLDSHSVAIQNILTTLKSLLPAVVTIPLSISLLSRHPCTPSNEVCGLRSGLLQVCPLTLLAIDETTMDEGELKEQGLKNLDAMQRLIKEQKLDFIYPFQSIEIDLDTRILVLSHAKSLLKTDIILPLSPQASSAMKMAGLNRKDSLLINRFREYVTAASSYAFTIPQDVSDMISESFASARKSAKASGSPLPTQDDLFATLTVARLLSLAKLEPSLSKNTWNEAVSLEAERKARL